MKLAVTALVAALSTSCSVFVQESVRSASVDCSTSLGWVATDLVLAGGFAFVASRGTGESPEPEFVLPAEVLAGTMVASAAIGLYKHHNCTQWRETAPPEVWASVAEGHRRAAEAQAAADAEAAQNQADAQAACPEGTTAVGDVCACPDGYVWDGSQCIDQASVQPGAAPAPPPSRTYVRNNVRSTTTYNNRTTINVRPSAPVYTQPAATPYHAMFQPSSAAAMSSCRAFGADMGGCSRFCTGLLAQRLRCQCAAGACP